MSCECGGYCRKCRGMIWSFLGVLLLLNAFIWPKWLDVDGWLAFFGLLLMLGGVWKAYVDGCSCPKDKECCKAECKPEHKEAHVEAHAEVHAVHHEAPAVAHKPRKRKK
jgi:hypothetical protein